MKIKKVFSADGWVSIVEKDGMGMEEAVVCFAVIEAEDGGDEIVPMLMNRDNGSIFPVYELEDDTLMGFVHDNDYDPSVDDGGTESCDCGLNL